MEYDMRRLGIIFLSVFCITLCRADDIDMELLFRNLDAVIDSSAFYQKQKTDAIMVMKKQFETTRTEQDRYQLAYTLYQEYSTFVNDSALRYLQVCIDCADRMGRKDLKAQSELAMAYQLADTGFYPEAEYHFNAILMDQLTPDMMVTYLSGRNHMFGEIAYYSHDKSLSRHFFAKADVMRDSLFNMLPQDSRDYISLKSMILSDQNQLDEALVYSDRWRRQVTPNTRPYAIMSFFRSEIYKKKGDIKMQQYWLIQSAMTDIRQAIMDQGALWSLANSIMLEGGDLDRAYKYMDFSWTCISQFSTHMRSWLVSPILTRINDKYKESLHQANTNLRWTVAAISLLVVGLLLTLYYVSRKRRQLTVARNELKSANNALGELNNQLSNSNEHLSKVNHLLSESNEKLRQAIMHLNDSNRVKDEYIGKFLSICSDYIDKLDNYRIKVNRKLKAGQQSDLLRMTGSDQLKEDELKELFDNFDDVFLRLFPTFVEDFNALLKPGEEIVPGEKDRLNTDLRIFALIRLGIEESSKIAEFLRYSPNSIYAYRARIKNKAAGNREEFENRVKEIGIHG